MNGIDPSSEEAEARIDAVLGEYALDAKEVGKIAGWVRDAVEAVAARGGHVRWIEELLAMGRLPAVTVWAKFDTAVVGGSVAPLEVIDFTFGSMRARDEAELAASIGAKLYRLVAGHAEPDSSLRPIAITELHAPSGTEITVIPTDDDVRAAWAEAERIAEEIRTARERGEFPATPGFHCAWCSYREDCPIALRGSGEIPL